MVYGINNKHGDNLSELQKKQRELGLLSVKINHLEKSLNRIQSSYSWKITAPLRFGAKVFRYFQRLSKRILKSILYRSAKNNGYSWVRMQDTNGFFCSVVLLYKIIRKLKKYPGGGMVRFQPRLQNLLEPLADNSSADLPENEKTVISTLFGHFVFAHEGWQDSVWPFAHKNKPDVFIFSVIDWDFRIQRPQHMALKLAEKGHRVFYISNHFVETSKTTFYLKKLDDSLPLYHLKLTLRGMPGIYLGLPSVLQQRQLVQNLTLLCYQLGFHSFFSIVQHPFWTDLAFSLPNNLVIYDCMDHHAGFDNTASDILEKEQELLAQAHLVLASSQKLYDEMKIYNANTALVRNAADYQHFAVKPEKIYENTQNKNKKIIGYYGAIAEWFDEEIIARLAVAFPEAIILLIGADTAGVQNKLKNFSNVVFTGEVAYDKLPYYLYAFSVCIIPFKINALTEATNPVKIYEYLSAGKPVVSIDLPELREMQKLNLVDLARNPEEFVACVQKVFEQKRDAESFSEMRRQYAATQDWCARIDALEKAVADLPMPLVSIIILTYNNLDLTKACLESIEKYTDYKNYEIIIVDNLSTDPTPEFLKYYQQNYQGQAQRVEIILNQANSGFAAGNNIGLRAARGDYLVVLNNDTEVTPGWLFTMVNHFRRHKNMGLLGPVTNNIGNEAKLNMYYKNLQEGFPDVLEKTLAHMGEVREMYTLAFFCVMMPRKIFEQIGGLDEDFGLGFFEDDDYCRRVQVLGYKLYCARDVFVHHHLSASFNKLKNSARQALFEKNKLIYEKKWGPWIPHQL